MSVLSTERNKHEEKLLTAFTNGVVPDSFLFAQEIRVQRAWAQGLLKLAVLTQEEQLKIDAALVKAHTLMSEGEFDWREEDEDIHMNLERFVNDEAQGLGKKMHLGRSRNDLISTTLKLNVIDQMQEVGAKIKGLISALTTLAESHTDILIPGMTHLQNGQPVRWSHALLGHAWALKRDFERTLSVSEHASESMPLGAAALAGTSLRIDLKSMAMELGFKNPPLNSYDAVGDRDAVVEAMQMYALLGAHVSRLCEDCIYWASAPVGLVKLPPAWSTGSSIMPNKRNPDIAELARGKASLWMGEMNGVLTLLKGVATSYGSDLHEAKIPYIRTTQDVLRTLEVLTHFVSGLMPVKERAESMLNAGHILATEVADYLAAQGVPFREAYQQVAALVELAEAKKIQIHELTPMDAAKIAPKLAGAFFSTLSFEAAVEKRSNLGGTAIPSVKKQIEALRSL